jgi:hypothetical protein
LPNSQCAYRSKGTRQNHLVQREQARDPLSDADLPFHYPSLFSTLNAENASVLLGFLAHVVDEKHRTGCSSQEHEEQRVGVFTATHQPRTYNHHRGPDQCVNDLCDTLFHFTLINFLDQITHFSFSSRFTNQIFSERVLD